MCNLGNSIFLYFIKTQLPCKQVNILIIHLYPVNILYSFYSFQLNIYHCTLVEYKLLFHFLNIILFWRYFSFFICWYHNICSLVGYILQFHVFNIFVFDFALCQVIGPELERILFFQRIYLFLYIPSTIFDISCCVGRFQFFLSCFCFHANVHRICYIHFVYGNMFIRILCKRPGELINLI